MDPTSLTALEFPEILGLLQAETVTPPGKAVAAAVRPSPEPAAARQELELTVEAGRYLEERGHLPFGTVPDAAPLLDRLGVDGSVLAPLEVLDLLALLKVGRALKSALTAHRAACPGLWAQARDLPDLGNLVRFIDGKIAASGEVEDHASDDLRLLRQDLRRSGERLNELLDGIVSRPEVARALQEDFVSLRSERHVIPIRSEARGALQGIVHGVSGSGATVYVEPLETVELNNEIVTLKDREAEEARRLLREYAGLLRSRLPEIRAMSDGIGRLDLLMARARLGRRMRARAPVLGGAGELILEGARHPLVEASLRSQGRRIVPLDLSISPGLRVLVISGPNTGGKTVALKTAGLFVLMAQSGLLIPAERAVLPVFQGVFIDIGDRQSISDGLSTFSARVKTIAAIARLLQVPALTLLDEVGTGTDPEEGVALAIAILDHLRSLGATVIATTHLEQLKAYAATTHDCANAAMQFDEATSSPTYHLAPGIPGRSGALEIAARLGLPEPILEAARALRPHAGRRIDEYLRRLEELSAALAGRLRSADEARARLERERIELEAALAEREQRRRRAAAEEIELALRALREAGERYLDTLKEREGAVRMRREETKAAATLRAEARRWIRRLAGQAPGAPQAGPGITPGTAVHVEAIDLRGHVQEVLGDRIVVLVRGKRVTVSRDDCRVELAAGPGDAARERPRLPRGVTLERRPADAAADEVHLRGRTVEEALAVVDKYLDDAYLASLSPVRLVHGIGSGRLKRAIAEMLSRHPHVEAFGSAPADEGGQGVTIVRLKL